MFFQFHLIAWINRFQRDNLKAHDQFPLEALKVKLNMSKNVLEEIDAPWQTVLGSMDSAFALCAVESIHLARSFSPYLFTFSSGIKGKNSAMDVQ
jgi:hypothetical protein